MGIIGQPASDLRAKGFVDYMKKSGVDVVAQQPTGWQADKASAAMQDWLVKYPDLSLVYALERHARGAGGERSTERQNRTCTEQKDWTKNSHCVAFVSVDGIFADQVRRGSCSRPSSYSPEWSGYLYREARGTTWRSGKKVPKTTTIDSFLVTPKNAACALKMINDMKTQDEDVPVRAVAPGDRVEDVPLQGARQEHVIAVAGPARRRSRHALSQRRLA